jgi:hypothetical protein
MRSGLTEQAYPLPGCPLLRRVQRAMERVGVRGHKAPRWHTQSKGSSYSTMKLGEFDIFPVTDGRFRLDGGAMFGTLRGNLPSGQH